MNTRRESARYHALHSESDLGEYRGAGDIELEQYSGSTRPSGSNDRNTYTNYGHTKYNLQETSTDGFLLPKGQEDSQTQPHDQRFFSGWRPGVLVCFIGVTSVFILNLVMTIWVWRNPDYQIQDGIGTLLQGSCARVRQLNVWAHLLVNILGTLLLCGSNYCMQILSAPNRAEIDTAHAHRHWLHIGVPSLHNLMRIGRDRALLWGLLMMSSMPLHLLFNSVIFTNLQANNYVVIPTKQDWLYGRRYDTSGFVGYNVSSSAFSAISLEIDSYRIDLDDTIQYGDGSMAPRYKNTSTAECFDQYSTQYTSNVGNVYLIQSYPTVFREPKSWKLAVNRTGQFIWYNNTKPPEGYTWQDANVTFPYLSKPSTFPANGWRCPSHRNATCDVGDSNEVPRDRSKWEPYESPVSYCMVEQVPEICKLQFSFLIASIVIVSNFIKACIIGWMMVRYKKHQALVTLGDAIASFLEHPDPTTRGRCLQSYSQIQLYFSARTMKPAETTSKHAGEPQPERFKLDRPRWSQAPSYGRWFGTYVFYFSGLLFGIVAINWSMENMPSNPIKLWKVGFGTVNGNNLMTTSTTVMGGVLLANSPQALLSYLYLAFNALYTNMFIGQEWSSYLHYRKTLRVTSPIGQQRDTYFLSVPFRFAIPMTIVSGLFHWLASQSLFMVQITVTDAETRKIAPKDQISTCGYSPFAIILTVVTATVIAISGIAIGRLRFPAGMPVASSCSAAISAACHPPPGDEDAQLLPVQWGAVNHGDVAEGAEEAVGHCSFSSLPVEAPIPGRLYA